MLSVTALSGFGARHGAHAPIGVAYLDTRGSETNATSYSLSGFGIDSHAGKLALVMVGSYESIDPDLPATVEVGGVSATMLEGQNTGSTEKTNGSLWIATLGGSPFDAVDIDYATLQANAYAAVFILTNARTTPHDTDWQNSAGAASLITATLDVVQNGAVFFLGMRREFTPQGNVDNGLTERADVDMENGFGGMLVADKAITTTATGEAFTMTCGSNNENLIAVAVSMAPA